MNVGELKEKLDDFNDALEVVIVIYDQEEGGDNPFELHPYEGVGSEEFDGTLVVGLRLGNEFAS
jgi:hypothetical protein